MFHYNCTDWSRCFAHLALHASLAQRRLMVCKSEASSCRVSLIGMQDALV